MRYEITYQLNGKPDANPELLKQAVDDFSLATEGNSKKELNGQPTFGFQVQWGKVAFEGEWGLIQEDLDDIRAVSKRNPLHELHIVKEWSNAAGSEIEDISSRYVKFIVKDGELVALLRPKNIEWEI